MTGTHIAYLKICHRKLWLYHHKIEMEQFSELVAEGRLIGATSYPQRAERWQEMQIEGIKIDHYDAVRRIVREVKKSNKKEEAHIAQVKYYLYVLRRNGITAEEGLIEYPKLRMTERVTLAPEEMDEVAQWEKEVETIVSREECPPVINKPMCKQCAYYDFCYTEE
jgi:CRISPR-associated exonuclease Cas4